MTGRRNAETAIHRAVHRLRAGAEPAMVARLGAGWVVLGERQVCRGYCLLLPDPVVPSLNDLDPARRRAFLGEMALVGDAVLEVTGADRINYEILGNLEPALHAHVIPRRVDEPEGLRHRPVWFHDWDAAPRFDPERDRPLQQALAEALARAGAAVAEEAGD